MDQPTKQYFAVLIVLIILGTVLSVPEFLPWYAAHGLDLQAFMAEAFRPGISAGLTWDLIITGMMVLTAAIWERDRIGLGWVCLITITMIFIGIYLGLAIFLLRREMHKPARA